MEVANTSAYYDKATITAVKCFYSRGPYNGRIHFESNKQ
jgi:hypothetical protein